MEKTKQTWWKPVDCSKCIKVNKLVVFLAGQKMLWFTFAQKWNIDYGSVVHLSCAILPFIFVHTRNTSIYAKQFCTILANS